MENIDKIVITDIDEIFTVLSPKEKFEKIHNRKSYGISFCIDGQITYSHNGVQTVSDKDCAIILPMGQTYTLHGDKAGLFPVINFRCENFSCDRIIKIPINNSESYIKNYEQMKALSVFEQNRTKIFSIFYDMLYRLSSQNQSKNIIMPAIAYLEKNYSDPNISITKLSSLCNISEVYFRKLFTEKYKMSPKQYIIDVRISKAKQLLTEGIIKINAIAGKCGFSNQYHFCRIFKKKTGLTPTEYMERNRIYKI